MAHGGHWSELPLRPRDKTSTADTHTAASAAENEFTLFDTKHHWLILISRPTSFGMENCSAFLEPLNDRTRHEMIMD